MSIILHFPKALSFYFNPYGETARESLYMLYEGLLLRNEVHKLYSKMHLD